MKLSEKPTTHLLLSARTNSQWDLCNFAIVPISEDWKNELQKRLNSIKPFTDFELISMTYYDTSVEFYKDDSELMLDLAELLKDKEWAFVTTKEEETEELSSPENALDYHELVVNANGTAYYKAYEKYTGEEFWTSNFSIQELIEFLNTDNWNTKK